MTNNEDSTTTQKKIIPTLHGLLDKNNKAKSVAKKN